MEYRSKIRTKPPAYGTKTDVQYRHIREKILRDTPIDLMHDTETDIKILAYRHIREKIGKNPIGYRQKLTWEKPPVTEYKSKVLSNGHTKMDTMI